VIVGTPFDSAWVTAKRISKELKLVQIDMDYRTVARIGTSTWGWSAIRERSWGRCCWRIGRIRATSGRPSQQVLSS